MNEVIIINLNGRAYQLEQQGYAKLKAYLAEAAKHLEADPDKDEIVSDLEQAVAEKFDRLLSAIKTVVTEKEIEQVISEMGNVESQSEEKKEGQGDEKKSEVKTKHLYRLREGAIIAGVCAGLAAYFNIDISLVRIIFVALTFMTGGAWIIAYVVLMFVLPQAETAAEMASAFGEPFTAQDFVNRARAGYEDISLKTKSEWKKWKYEMKQKRREERWKRRHYNYTTMPAYTYSPFWRLVMVFISLAWLVGLVTLIARGTVFGIAVSPFFPIWAAVIGWFFVYSIIIRPLKWQARMPFCGNGGNQINYHNHCSGFFGFIGNLVVWALVLIALWHFVPTSHQYFLSVKDWLNNLNAKYNN
jgi:phage shock protein PspC (stress-responsive transcriptional regulator)